MKARVKATGEIVEVVHYSGYGDYDYICHENESVYDAEELEFEDEPDYWTRLEHTYAGMAMQGVISRTHWSEVKDITEYAVKIAHALVEKMKEAK